MAPVSAPESKNVELAIERECDMPAKVSQGMGCSILTSCAGAFGVKGYQCIATRRLIAKRSNFVQSFGIRCTSANRSERTGKLEKSAPIFC